MHARTEVVPLSERIGIAIRSDSRRRTPANRASTGRHRAVRNKHFTKNELGGRLHFLPYRSADWHAACIMSGRNGSVKGDRGSAFCSVPSELSQIRDPTGPLIGSLVFWTSFTSKSLPGAGYPFLAGCRVPHFSRTLREVGLLNLSPTLQTAYLKKYTEPPSSLL